MSQGHVDSKPQLLAGHTGVVRCLLLAEQEGLGAEGRSKTGGSGRSVLLFGRFGPPAVGRPPGGGSLGGRRRRRGERAPAAPWRPLNPPSPTPPPPQLPPPYD